MIFFATYWTIYVIVYILFCKRGTNGVLLRSKKANVGCLSQTRIKPSKSSLLILICSCSQTQSFATMATSTVSSSSSYFTGKSDEEIEEMLDRMLTRLALCDDPQLENLLLKLLPVTISSLSRPSSAVRTKVLSANSLFLFSLCL